jgi:hypothetical protein
MEEDPTAEVYVITRWIDDSSWEEDAEDLVSRKMGFNVSHNQRRWKIYLLIDDAQDTYSDFQLWNVFFKEVAYGNFGVNVALFCSYGDAGRQPVPFYRQVLPSKASITLRPRKSHLHDWEEPVGLLLTSEEYLELVRRFPEQERKPSNDFIDYIYNITSGHVGAVQAILNMAGDGMVSRQRVPFPRNLNSAR